jgi:hypothetical protein
MKKVSFLFGLQNDQILVSIIGFILFLLFGNNLYVAYIEHIVNDYKNAIKNRVFVRIKQSRYIQMNVNKSLRA